MAVIRYVGSSRGGVFLPGDIFVPHGQEVEVSDELAAEYASWSYCGSPEWEAVPPAKSKPAAVKE